MDETDEMVKLLLARARMLKYHCPRCSLPLFEKEGQVICVKCGEVRVEKEYVKSEDIELESGSRLGMLEKKKEELLKRLESESDPKTITSILEALQSVEKTLKDSR